MTSPFATNIKESPDIEYHFGIALHPETVSEITSPAQIIVSAPALISGTFEFKQALSNPEASPVAAEKST